MLLDKELLEINTMEAEFRMASLTTNVHGPSHQSSTVQGNFAIKVPIKADEKPNLGFSSFDFKKNKFLQNNTEEPKNLWRIHAKKVPINQMSDL